MRRFRRIHSPELKGILGETIFSFTSFLGLGQDWQVLQDVVIPAQDGTTQIDQILVSKYGIFVVEIKSYKGWIFGQEKASQWTQSLPGRKYHFQNPLFQNYKHIKALQSLTGLSENIFKSVVVFAGEAVFKTTMPDNVLKGIKYLEYIKSFREIVLTDQEIARTLKSIADHRLTAGDHRDYIQKRKEKDYQENPSPYVVPDQGFCIRCSQKIPINIKHPYCLSCYQVWDQYKNRNYTETYCHACGDRKLSSMNKPMCYPCYKKQGTS